MLITTYKEANQLQSSCLLLLCLSLHHTCSVANQVQARDIRTSLMCRVCVCHLKCTRQNCVQQCMHMPVFEILHTLNVQAHACTCMHV